MQRDVFSAGRVVSLIQQESSINTCRSSLTTFSPDGFVAVDYGTDIRAKLNCSLWPKQISVQARYRPASDIPRNPTFVLIRNSPGLRSSPDREARFYCTTARGLRRSELTRVKCPSGKPIARFNW